MPPEIGRSKVRPRPAPDFAPPAHRRQVVARARVEQRVVGDRAGRDDAGHLAAHETFGRLGVFDLVADGHSQPGSDQLAQVAFELMVGKAGHRHRVFALVAAGEGQVPAARAALLRVVEKHFVEIAHAKQQQRIGTRRFGVLILLHHGRNGHRGTSSLHATQCYQTLSGRGRARRSQ